MSETESKIAYEEFSEWEITPNDENETKSKLIARYRNELNYPRTGESIVIQLEVQ